MFLPLSWLGYLLSMPPKGVDFYPLYFAAQRVLLGQTPYGIEATNALKVHWDAVFADAGVAYPLPLIMLVVPFVAFAFPIAAFLWTAMGFAMSYPCVILSRDQSALQGHAKWYQWLSLLLPFTYWPFYRAVGASQATLVWFGLAVLLVLAIRRNNSWVTAICAALLALKPQNGVIFALFGLYWLYRNHKRSLALAITLGTLLLGISLAIQPTWITAWLEQVKVYDVVVNQPSLLPLASILLFVSWRLRMEWWAKVAIVQVLLFPMSDVYSTLPLLLAWCSFSPLLAFFGTILSWVWPLFDLPMSLAMIWLLVLIPLTFAAFWEARPAQLRLPAGQPNRYLNAAPVLEETQ
jgi:hypothetical protein